MSTHPLPFLTPEQYLEIERKAEFRSEYYKGEMFAMAGGSRVHNEVITNVIAELAPQLRSKGCRIYHESVRLRVEASGLHTYPDIAIVCAEPEFVGEDTLLNPVTILEILS